jgi:hypothetical protein
MRGFDMDPMRGFDTDPMRGFDMDSDAIPTGLDMDSDAIIIYPNPWCATERALRRCAAGRTALIVEVRIIINRHPAIFFRLEFIIFRMIHLDFMCFVDEEPEIIPELVFVSHALCHNMT